MKKRSATFKLEGLMELEQALRELPKEVGKNILWNAAMHGAEVVREEVQDQIRAKGLIDSGFLLEAQIKRREKTDHPMIAAYRIGAKAKAFYDLFLEFGTRKMPARPYLLPALEASRAAAFDKVKEVLARRIKTAARRAAKLRRRAIIR